MNKDDCVNEVIKSMRKIYPGSDPFIIQHLNEYIANTRSTPDLKDMMIDNCFKNKGAIFGKSQSENAQKNFQYVFASIVEDCELAYIAVVGKSSFWNKKKENGSLDVKEINKLGDLFETYKRICKTVNCVCEYTKCKTIKDVNENITTAVILPIDVHDCESDELKGHSSTEADERTENYETELGDDLLKRGISILNCCSHK